jgi:serine/threonine protein kinase
MFNPNFTERFVTKMLCNLLVHARDLLFCVLLQVYSHFLFPQCHLDSLAFVLWNIACISSLFLFFLLLPEFMHGGSIFDFLYNRRGNFQLPDVIRIASDVSKGMNYLHQINIVHRDLKTANLLMDDQVLNCTV